MSHVGLINYFDMKLDHSLDDGELVMVITNREYEEMYYIYELWDGYTSAARKKYLHCYSSYPDRRVPSAHNDLGT